MAKSHAPIPLTEHKLLRLSSAKFALIIIVTAMVGLFSSFMLTVEKIHVLKDPLYNPICNINPIFSCGSVMQSSQAEVFGIPNTLFGVVGFAAVIAIGAAMLAGAYMHKRFWQLWLVGMGAGFLGFVYLYYQSVFTLKTLCLFCISVWMILLPLVWYSLLWCLEHKHVTLPTRFDPIVRFVRREHLSILLLVYIVLAAIIVHRFWYFFSTL